MRSQRRNGTRSPGARASGSREPRLQLSVGVKESRPDGPPTVAFGEFDGRSTACGRPRVGVQQQSRWPDASAIPFNAPPYPGCGGGKARVRKAVADDSCGQNPSTRVDDDPRSHFDSLRWRSDGRAYCADDDSGRRQRGQYDPRLRPVLRAAGGASSSARPSHPGSTPARRQGHRRLLRLAEPGRSTARATAGDPIDPAITGRCACARGGRAAHGSPLSRQLAWASGSCAACPRGRPTAAAPNTRGRRAAARRMAARPRRDPPAGDGAVRRRASQRGIRASSSTTTHSTGRMSCVARRADAAPGAPARGGGWRRYRRHAAAVRCHRSPSAAWTPSIRQPAELTKVPLVDVPERPLDVGTEPAIVFVSGFAIAKRGRSALAGGTIFPRVAALVPEARLGSSGMRLARGCWHWRRRSRPLRSRRDAFSTAPPPWSRDPHRRHAREGARVARRRKALVASPRAAESRGWRATTARRRGRRQDGRRARVVSSTRAPTPPHGRPPWAESTSAGSAASPRSKTLTRWAASADEVKQIARRQCSTVRSLRPALR